MKKFVFKLKGLLRLKQIEVDKIEVELRASAQQLSQLTERLSKIHEQRRGTFGCLSNMNDGVLEMNLVIQHQRFLNTLDGDERRLLVQIENAKVQHQLNQEKTAEAKRQHQAVEKLEQKDRALHQQQMEREETSELDEQSRTLAQLRAELSS